MLLIDDLSFVLLTGKNCSLGWTNC